MIIVSQVENGTSDLLQKWSSSIKWSWCNEMNLKWRIPTHPHKLLCHYNIVFILPHSHLFHVRKISFIVSMEPSILPIQIPRIRQINSWVPQAMQMTMCVWINICRRLYCGMLLGSIPLHCARIRSLYKTIICCIHVMSRFIQQKRELYLSIVNNK